MLRLPARFAVSLFVAGTAVATLPSLSAAQVVVVDEGTFSLMVGGVRVGREDFSIRRAAPNAASAFVAQGNVLLRETRLAVALNTDSLGAPLRFQLETFRAGRSTENITGEWRRGLWSGRVVSTGGESAREFRLPLGSLVAEDGVVHQIWFLLRFGAGRTTTQLLPRGLTLREIRVEEAGREPVSIGLRDFDALKWVVRSVKEGTVLREAWTDESGRLLRVRVPAQDLEALRDEAPAETPVVRPA